MFSASDDTQKSHRSRNRPHKSSGSSHKTVSRSLSCDSHSKTSFTTSRGSVVSQLYHQWSKIQLCQSFSSNMNWASFGHWDLCTWFTSHMMFYWTGWASSQVVVKVIFLFCNVFFQKVDLSKLEMAALRRYWRHFKLVSKINIRNYSVGLSVPIWIEAPCECIASLGVAERITFLQIQYMNMYINV